MANIVVPCHCCGKQYPVEWMWYVCDSCDYRICPSRLAKHRGKYNTSDGMKCSQCISGTLRSKHSAM